MSIIIGKSSLKTHTHLINALYIKIIFSRALRPSSVCGGGGGGIEMGGGRNGS